MSGYSGFFVRDSLASTPGQPETGAWNASPDIVESGMQPMWVAAQIVGASGYALDYGANAFLEAPNFVYARALNSRAGAAKGRAWLYWTSADLLMWPQNWQSDGITVGGEWRNYQDIAASAGNQVCMANLPFVWTSRPPPVSGSPYLHILWIENEPSDPPASPAAKLPPFASADALAKFVLATPNMGMRSLDCARGKGPAWTQTVSITAPPGEPQPFYIGVQCRNMPTDGLVGFAVPAPDPAVRTMFVQPTPVTWPDLLMTVPILGWPAGGQSSITVNFWQGATPVPAGAQLATVMVLPGVGIIGSGATLFER